MLEAKNISHSFDYELFNDLSFKLEKAQSMAILGVSGSGKSTLLHILSSFIEPNKGEVFIDGKKLSSLKQKELEKLRRDTIGIIFQQHYLFRGLSAKENICLSSMLTGKEIPSDLTSNLGIEHVLNQNALELSGGQQQRVSVARVLAKSPKIIFADEPTGNLDKENAKELASILFDYVKNGSSLVLVTHDENLAMLCDHVYKIEDLNLVLFSKNAK